MKNAAILTVLVAALCSTVFADQIGLKNGDRITGTIVKSDAKTLVMKTDYAGELTVDWSAVQDMTSTQNLHVELKNGRTVVGPVTITEGKVQVGSQPSATAETPKEDVSVIRSDAGQLAYEKSLHPRLMEGWNGGANVGFGLTRGNSQTKNLAIAFNAARPTLHDKLSLYATSIYASNDAAGATPSTTANANAGGIRYDHNLNPRLFAFVGGDFMGNGLQELDLRSVITGGLGFHLIKTPATTLDLLAGLNYTHESYSAFIAPGGILQPSVTRSLAGLTLGDDFAHKAGKGTVITQNFFFYPNLTDTGQYRGTFSFGTITKMGKRLGWQNQFGDIYVSNPPLGTKKNDIVFTTGLNVSFTH
jgi:hypothetical protein